MKRILDALSRANTLVIGLAIGLLLGVTTTTVIAQQTDRQTGEQPQADNDKPEVVMSEGLAPTRNSPDGNAQILSLAEGDNAFVGKLSVAPGASLPEHTDDAEEYLYVLRGKGTITINGNEYDVQPRTIIYIPPGAKTTYKNDSQKLVALQVFAGPEPADKYTKWNVGGSPIQSGQPNRGTNNSGSQNRSQ